MIISYDIAIAYDKFKFFNLSNILFYFFLGCIVKKYSQKTVDRHWNEIRRAINQKCNDLRKKHVHVN